MTMLLAQMGLDPIDNRPDRGGWIWGGWTVQCGKCRHHFLGSRQATECADCAYEEQAGLDLTAKAGNPSTGETNEDDARHA